MRTIAMHLALILIVGVAPFAAAGALAASGDSYTTPAEAFEALKRLEGEWTGKAAGSEGEMETTEEFRVSAGGTVVMEIMHPGSDHEMINMYHLDGDDLMLTHYCAGGNQPRMRLDAASLADGRLAFNFMDATNLNPETDGHIHSADLTIVGDDRVEATWTGWQGGQEAAAMNFVLERKN